MKRDLNFIYELGKGKDKKEILNNFRSRVKNT